MYEHKRSGQELRNLEEALQGVCDIPACEMCKRPIMGHRNLEHKSGTFNEDDTLLNYLGQYLLWRNGIAGCLPEDVRKHHLVQQGLKQFQDNLSQAYHDIHQITGTEEISEKMVWQARTYTQHQ